MKTTEHNRLNMVASTSGVIEKYNTVWKDHEAFTEGVDALTETEAAIKYQILIAEGNPGASDLKDLTLKALSKSVNEVIGATLSYAKKVADPELAAKVNYSPTDVVAGKASEVVTRCTKIYNAASEVADELVKYGITTAKLTALNKKIDAFDKVKVAPRQSQVEKSAATQLLTQLVSEAVRILRDDLDGLMVQFQDANPNFYAEYFAARVIVDNSATHAENVKPATTPETTPEKVV
jgi:hypothetical protein